MVTLAAPLARLLLLLCLLTASASGNGHAAARTYRLEPVHTRLVFMVEHAGLSRALGSFSGVEGTLQLDPEDLTSAAVQVRIPIASLDLGDAGWRKAILSDSWLAAEAFPEACFVSTRVEQDEHGLLRIHGELSLRGVTREITLTAKLNAIKRHPLTLRRSVGFSATAQLRRSDFGITAWKSLVGDSVDLLIEVEAVRARKSESPEKIHANPQ